MARAFHSFLVAGVLLATCATSANAAPEWLRDGDSVAAYDSNPTPAPTDSCYNEDWGDKACKYCPPELNGKCYNLQPLCRGSTDPRGDYQARRVK